MESEAYEMMESLGEGCFGKVMKCINTKTKEILAIKVLKDDDKMDAELKMLRLIRQVDPDSYNIVRFIDDFESNIGRCMAFEMLDRSMISLMLEQMKPFTLSEIRAMAQQLLVALKGLKSLGVMHTDIKDDNIMLVNHKSNPFKIKLIDFGLAMHHTDAKLGTVIQPTAFRSPEVTLGLPLSEAVDMWSLGCWLGMGYLGHYLFDGEDPYDVMRSIVHLLGTPEQELLECGLYTSDYFVWTGSEWRLKTIQEYQMSTGNCPSMSESWLYLASDLEVVIQRYHPEQTLPELDDRAAFGDLLKKMLHLNPAERITPTEALEHPFITMAHLTEDSPYTQEAKSLMARATTAVQTKSSEDTSDIDLDTDSNEIRSVCVPPSPPLQECSGFGINPSQPNIDENHQSLQSEEGRSPGEISKDNDWDMDSNDIRSVCENHRSLQNEDGRSPGEVSKGPSSETSERSRTDDESDSAHPPRETQSSAVNVQNMYRENNPGKKYYQVKVLGEGNFGIVVKCLNTETQKMVALKILKKNQQRTTKREVDMLIFLSQLDPDSNNIVRFIEYFQLNKSPCLVFEMLHSSVWKLMVQRKRQPFALSEIRAMAQQLLVALKGLKSLGVMHTDIKPDNIMLVNHKKNPFKVKLIDFGLAMHHSDTKVGTAMQPPAFRSPEVTLGLPLSEAVDMWSLGCCLGQWYLGRYLFSGKNPYAIMRNIVHFMGIPEDEFLECGLNTRDYFVWTGSEWRLKTVDEYQMSTGICPVVSNKYLKLGSDIEDVLISYHPEPPLHELDDRVAFADLLKMMLHLNPAERITPTEALEHPFITMAHLSDDSPYTQEAKSLMTHATTTDKKQ